MKVSLNKSLRKNLSTVSVFIVFVIIILLILQIPALSGISHGIQSGFTRIGTTLNNAFNRLTKSENQLIIERDNYQALAAELAVDQAKLQQLERDVREMQALLEYKESAPYKEIASRVIARSEAGQHTILIDKGEVDGVRPRLAVVVENGHMIGFIDSVRKNSSTVVLLEHEASKIPSMILNTDETIGLIEGKEGFLLRMGFIPQRIELKESDVVVTSGLDGVFPQGLIIGAIESIEKNETAAFQEAFIQPFYDPNEFTNVLILDPFSEEL